MNFNFNNGPEYALNTSLIEEMISLYGVKLKLLLVDRINRDDAVFGDHSHVKTDTDDSIEIWALPENTEDWDSQEYGFGSFGLVNANAISLFVARSAFVKDTVAIPPQQITGNLLVFPNNKLMEITDTKPVVAGVNNLFTYGNQKSVYQLFCKPYDVKLNDELNPLDISADDEPYESLDHYFDELTANRTQQDQAVADLTVPAVKDNGDNDIAVQKPIVDKSTSQVWGDFE